jgi:hypothetical protein
MCQRGNRRVLRAEPHGDATVLADRNQSKRLNRPHGRGYADPAARYRSGWRTSSTYSSGSSVTSTPPRRGQCDLESYEAVAVWGQPVCLFWLCQPDSRRLQRRESGMGCGRSSAQPGPSGAGRPGPPALRAEHLFGHSDLFRAGGLVGAAREGPSAE